MRRNSGINEISLIWKDNSSGVYSLPSGNLLKIYIKILVHTIGTSQPRKIQNFEANINKLDRFVLDIDY